MIKYEDSLLGCRENVGKKEEKNENFKFFLGGFSFPCMFG